MTNCILAHRNCITPIQYYYLCTLLKRIYRLIDCFCSFMCNIATSALSCPGLLIMSVALDNVISRSRINLQRLDAFRSFNFLHIELLQLR